MRLFRKPGRVEFSIQHGEHLYMKASGPGVDILPTVSKWLADNPVKPAEVDKPKTGFNK